MYAFHLVGLSTLLLLAPPKAPTASKPTEAVPAKSAAAAKPAANDAVQRLIETGELKGAFNPIVLDFLVEEAKGKLPEAQRTAAIAQFVTALAAEVKVDKGTVARAHLLTAAGALIGGDVGEALSSAMSQVWTEWVNAAFILQKAGHKAEAAAFFEKCVHDFALPELRARCTVGLAAQEPERAFALVLGLVDNGGPNGPSDTETTNLGLRLLGSMAGSDALGKAEKDRALEELMRRTKGFSNIEHKIAAAEGLVATGDPRAVESLRAMTKGTFKDVEASRIATRGLFLVFKDPEATESLQKQLKGGFLSQPEDQVRAGTILIQGGHAAGFEWAAKFLSKKPKDEQVWLALELVHALGAKGGDEAKRVLAQALAAQKPKEWLTASIAIQLLALGDESGLAVVKDTLTKKDWPETQIEAAVVLGRRGDLSGVPVLKQMMEKLGIGGSLKLFATGGHRLDPKTARIEVADALARIDSAETVPILIGLLDDKSPAVRSSAAEGLARMVNTSAPDGMTHALEVDYGTLGGRSVNPEQHALLVRSAALHFPNDARLPAILAKALESKAASVRFLATAESKVLAR